MGAYMPFSGTHHSRISAGSHPHIPLMAESPPTALVFWKGGHRADTSGSPVHWAFIDRSTPEPEAENSRSPFPAEADSWAPRLCPGSKPPLPPVLPGHLLPTQAEAAGPEEGR